MSDGEQMIAAWQTQIGGNINEVVILDGAAATYLPTLIFDGQVAEPLLFQGIPYVFNFGLTHGVFRFINGTWEQILSGSVTSLRVRNNFLYILLTGSTDTINGQYFNFIAAFDGTDLHVVDNDISDGSWGFAYPLDAIWYKNQFYLGGNMTLPGFYEIARWNPVTDVWSDVDGGFPGDNVVVGFVEYHGLLIIYGEFSESTGCPSNNIVAWDGDRFWQMGTGTNSAVGDAVVFHDELYITGWFDEVNGVPAEGFAKWNGHQWCGLPAGTAPSNMTVFRDSIYGIQVKNSEFTSSEPMIRLGRWVYDGPPLGCAETEAIGVGEVDGREMTLSLFPNPTTSHLRIRCGSPMRQLSITDAMGRVVLIKSMEPQTTNYEFETSSLTPGLYVLRAETEGGWRSARFVRE